MASISWRRINRTPEACTMCGNRWGSSSLRTALGGIPKMRLALGIVSPEDSGAVWGGRQSEWAPAAVSAPVVVDPSGGFDLTRRHRATTEQTGRLFRRATEDGDQVEPRGHAPHRMPSRRDDVP